MAENLVSIKKGTVVKILKSDEFRTDIIVDLDGKYEAAINYNQLTGKINEFDTVILNTTAVEYNLGTGGYHFVINNIKREKLVVDNVGHIMKLRYTPLQVKVKAAEEQGSPHHKVFVNFTSLRGFPVIVGSIHSMLLPTVITLNHLNPKLKIAYIMTDGASLPIAFSNTVVNMQKEKLIKATITIGHAFGGDIECVNIYNGLIAAKEIVMADVAIVTMGPGIVGTGTPYGFSGIEQGRRN